ncbi:Uncharacterised protein [Serratia quinivorans]|nr:Uncharacterised protein [Serratia quinivorans]
MNMYMRSLHFGFAAFALSVAWPSAAALTVSVMTPPTSPNAHFISKVVAGSVSDPTPNPCYNDDTCRLRFFTISKRWLPSGYDGYTTVDTGEWYQTGGRKNSDYRTLGALWGDTTNKGRVSSDFLPNSWGTDACVVVAASSGFQHTMRANSIVSNCAEGLVQAAGCVLSPPQIQVRLDAVLGQEAKEERISGVSLACNEPTVLRIEANDNGAIPLGGDSNVVALTDWGGGYSKPGIYHTDGMSRLTVDLRVKTRGVTRLGAGIYSGSGIVNVTYY